MKFSFSTLGCPRWSWREILAAAKDLGYSGIELRGIGDEMYMPNVDIFSPEKLLNTKAELARRNIEIPCVTSGVMIHHSDIDQLAALRCYIALAANLGSPNIRVLGDTDGGKPSAAHDGDLVAKRLKAAAPLAEAAGICLLIETNGVYAESSVLKKLIEDVSSPAVRVLWDISHPVRYFAEDPEKTYENIGKYVRHVHAKDSVASDNGTALKMLGYGDLPVEKCFSLLKNGGFNGYISLEWLKRWNAELEDPGVVFSHFIHAARSIWENV